MELNLNVNTPQPDDVYQILVDLHEGLTPEQSLRVYSKLTLLLTNHIGDLEVIKQAAEIARTNVDS